MLMSKVYSHLYILVAVIGKIGFVWGLITTAKLFYYKNRKIKGCFSIKMPSGKRVFLRGGSSDIETFLDVIIGRQYELHFTIKPKWIIDLGANVGLSSIFFAEKYSDAKIISVEPDRGNFLMLEKNLEGVTRVKCKFAAIWSKPVPLFLSDPGIGEWGYQVSEQSNDDKPVQGITVQNLMQEYEINEIDILKIDIEGAEFQLFTEGDVEWLQKVKVLIIELHEHALDVLREIVKFDFHVYSNGETIVFVNRDYWNMLKR